MTGAVRAVAVVLGVARAAPRRIAGRYSGVSLGVRLRF